MNVALCRRHGFREYEVHLSVFLCVCVFLCRLLLKMQASTVSPVTNTTTTKTNEQILIQSSGAMIVVIVLGIIVVLAILLIILKTYNRRTHVSRVLGASRGSRPQPKSSLTTVNSGVPLNLMGPDSASGGAFGSNPASENDSQLPSASLPSAEGNPIEQLSTISESPAMTPSDAPSIGNT
ncbi:noncompact myelin-associated protein [Pseudoliparis swirei]|uniref:noncompact myelin-associated protein n=1 Tax=Pseudoliparis swirei TaxID=2059687 RepID=UPI0024BE23AF|nr:noncompact myelin-associated protein [Pseudoliparis swirei]